MEQTTDGAAAVASLLTAQVLVVMEEQRWRSWPIAWANVK